jgi:hypothetical protein
MEIEFRWYKYARALSPVLQFREKEGPIGEDWWGKWQDVPTVFEHDYGY